MIKPSCFNCGADVDADDYERVGSQKLYVCGTQECNRELRNELRAYEDEVQDEARQDNYNRYR